ncbi:VCBS repeat-containing protein [Streptomyces sp. NPDC096079]|uniref:FG-GAP repeat domain-containing protein n=1 Tax=Streptomyces sp. NPDC096079 TaxID=3155820 RepID=UPI00331E9BC5
MTRRFPGRETPASARPRRRPARAGLLAACTGLAVLAGLALAQPAAAGTVPAPPRADFYRDGSHSDLYYRSYGGSLELRTGLGTTGHFDVAVDEAYKNIAIKDYIAVGGIESLTEVLHLTADGELKPLYVFYDSSWFNVFGPRSTDRSWRKYNKVLSPGDLNDDGKADVLARTPDGDVYLHLAGDLASATRVASGWQAYDQVVGASDANGDGVGDVYTRTPKGELFFHAGTGDPARMFAEPVRVGTGWGVYNQVAGGDDMDGDGVSDLVARTVEGRLYLYSGDGRGGLGARTLRPGGTSWKDAEVFAGAGGVPAFGKNGIQALGTDGKLYEYRTLGDGTLSARKLARTPARCGTGPAVRGLAVDLALDGRPDLLTVCGGKLSASATDRTGIGAGWDAYDRILGPGDLTGDGVGDLLARDRSGTLYVYRTDPGLATPAGTAFDARVKVGTGWQAYDRILGAGDYTGDGRADIVARTPAGELYLYAGTGRGAAPFAARVRIGTGWQAYGKLAAAADLDGDGRGDLLAVDRAGVLYRYSSTGTGAFKPRVAIGAGWNVYRDLF